jgi:hypothetical protein
VGHAVGERGERPALVEVPQVDDVPCGPEVVRECADAIGQSLGMVEDDQLAHPPESY